MDMVLDKRLFFVELLSVIGVLLSITYINYISSLGFLVIASTVFILTVFPVLILVRSASVIAALLERCWSCLSIEIVRLTIMIGVWLFFAYWYGGFIS